MKKIILIIPIALTAFSSCKKERTCECSVTITMTENGVPVPLGLTSYKNTSKMTKVSKGTAKANCVNGTQTETYNDSGDAYIETYVTTCELK
ncbi:MAG: hypothetical protein ACK5QC_10845 [Bacteroidota bacterium]|jgi:hypothetical protein|nr:hypothetical protein [Bacteroidota bacterium]MCA6444430.1 hypothetical protein [Bacteroidota bacterium]